MQDQMMAIIPKLALVLVLVLLYTSGNIQSHHNFKLYTFSLFSMIVVVGSGILVVCCKRWITRRRSRTVTVPNVFEEPVYETISIAMDEIPTKETKDDFTLADNDAYTVFHFDSTAHNKVNVSNINSNMIHLIYK